MPWSVETQEQFSAGSVAEAWLLAWRCGDFWCQMAQQTHGIRDCRAAQCCAGIFLRSVGVVLRAPGVEESHAAIWPAVVKSESAMQFSSPVGLPNRGDQGFCPVQCLGTLMPVSVRTADCSVTETLMPDSFWEPSSRSAFETTPQDSREDHPGVRVVVPRSLRSPVAKPGRPRPPRSSVWPSQA